MQPCIDEVVDNLDSLSFESTSTTTGSETTMWAPPSGDPRRDAIRRHQSALRLEDFHFLRRLGSGDIGSVYLVELKCTGGCMFAAKVMDKEELESRNKEGRAWIERGILELLDHPFLPSLYATLDSPRWSVLLTEYCPGGDLHVLRQSLPDKRFHEAAVR